MTLRKFDKSFAPPTKEIRYLAKTFPQFRQSLIDFAKVYFPNSYTDFNEASPGMMFIEMASYVGDVLSYYIDTQFRENLMQYAEEQDNIISLAQAFGFKPKPSTAASTDADFYQLCPAAGLAQNYEPDTRYLLRIATNAIVSSDEYQSVTFRTTAEINFADPTDREITLFSIDANNKPLTYLVRKKARVVSGDIREVQVTFGAAERFVNVLIPDENVLEVLSVVDSNGFTWHEVDYLAQDLILEARDNTSPTVASTQSIPPTYVMKIKRTPRRFVTRYNSDFKLELQFGSGVLDDTDESINLEPKKIANDEYQHNLASTSLDPSDFLSSRSYGLAPANTTMTIKYVAGGGLSSNVPSATITKIRTVDVLTSRDSFVQPELQLFDDVVASLAVNNPLPATGGKDQDSVEEIRQNALAFFNSQNRTVNADDYAVRAYAMPPKFGGVAKAFVAQDEQINSVIRTTNDQAPVGGIFVNDKIGRNVINLYTLGYNNNKKLVRLNDDVKKNLRTYIDQYRILTDEIRILDAFVVNIGVDFRIVVFKNFNINDVLTRCIDSIKNFFDIDKWQINQPIILTDLITELATVEGVQSVTYVKIKNKYRYRDGADYEDYLYDIDSALDNGVIYPSLDPMMWEVRYPQNDIVGSATQ